MCEVEFSCVSYEIWHDVPFFFAKLQAPNPERETRVESVRTVWRGGLVWGVLGAWGGGGVGSGGGGGWGFGLLC